MSPSAAFHLARGGLAAPSKGMTGRQASVTQTMAAAKLGSFFGGQRAERLAILQAVTGLVAAKTEWLTIRISFGTSSLLVSVRAGMSTFSTLVQLLSGDFGGALVGCCPGA